MDSPPSDIFLIPVDNAITRFRRGLVLSQWLNTLLVGVTGTCLLLGPILGSSKLGGAAVAVGVLWLMLSYRSVRGSRLAADSHLLIAAGQYEQAERKIDSALRSFSLFRSTQLLSLHHLAVLRQAQHRWQESARLCRALLGQRLTSVPRISRSSRLILAESLLELGDVAGAYQALIELYRQRLSLPEALTLLRLQSEYLARIGDWHGLMEGAWTKVQLAELMPTEAAASTQAFLALAAQRLGRRDWADWLRQRVQLLVDLPRLVERTPVLQPLLDAKPTGGNG